VEFYALYLCQEAAAMMTLSLVKAERMHEILLMNLTKKQFSESFERRDFWCVERGCDIRENDRKERWGERGVGDVTDFFVTASHYWPPRSAASVICGVCKVHYLRSRETLMKLTPMAE